MAELLISNTCRNGMEPRLLVIIPITTRITPGTAQAVT
jgi:hypothetical protein